jgi:DNA replication and repair protein RecF
MITNIQLKNIRKFDKLNLNINSSKVLLFGSNAVGKTSVLESISLASITKSHRTNNLKEIIKENEPFSDIKITYENNLYRVVLSNDGKRVSINNNEKKRLSEYIGLLPTIFFSPSDLDIVTSSPTIRRQFVNQEISQLSTTYISNLNTYNKLLQERNLCLKEMNLESDKKMLDVITMQLVEYVKKIMDEREKFVNEINSIINEVHSKINSNEFIKIVYQPSISIKELYEFYQSKYQLDISSHQTNYGIHRDDFVFLINEKNAMKYASQGQIRNVILSTKLSLCKIIYQYKNKYPILLLDDVLSELDVTRQNNLLNIIEEFGQTFISTADTSSLNNEILKKYQLIKL